MMTYKVEVYRDGRWWMVRIPEIDGLTQARSLAAVAPMARSYIALWRDVSEDSFSVEIVQRQDAGG